MTETMTLTSTITYDDGRSETSSLVVQTPSLREAVAAFDRFLRGAGYHYEGNVTIDFDEIPEQKNLNEKPF